MSRRGASGSPLEVERVRSEATLEVPEGLRTSERSTSLSARHATLSLPWPPTLNSYWRRVGAKTLLSAKARAYRAEVLAKCAEQKAPHHADHRLRVDIDACPPDRRARDLDNLPKGILDSLQHARVIDDDSHIDVLTVTRREVIKGGRVIVTVSVIP